MYICEPRENVEFDNFEESAKLSEKFKKSLRKFEDVDEEDSFFWRYFIWNFNKVIK